MLALLQLLSLRTSPSLMHLLKAGIATPLLPDAWHVQLESDADVGGGHDASLTV